MINTSSTITQIGSENCSPVIHKKYSCGGTDFLITSISIDHETGVLTIYQNPDNCKSVTIPELLRIEEFRKIIANVVNNKVDRTYALHTTNGIQGGGTFENELTLSIKPNDSHIEVTESGLRIKKFNEVDTSGVVPSPEVDKKTGEFFLNARGEWTKLGFMRLKGVIEGNTTIDNLDEGDVYIIKEFEDPEAEVIVNGQTFYSSDIIMYNGTEFVDVGQVSVKVDLSIPESKHTQGQIIINNTAGTGVTLPSVTGSKAGLMSAQDKNVLDTLKGVIYLKNTGSVTSNSNGVNISIGTYQYGRTTDNLVLTIPKASSETNGVMTPAQVKKLDKLTDEYLQSDWNIQGTTTQDQSLAAFIKNKPAILGSSTVPNASNCVLISPPTGIDNTTGKDGSMEWYLRFDGKWSKVKSSPPVTVSTSEPTGVNATEGAVWIIP